MPISGCGKVDGVGDGIDVVGIDGDEFVAFAEFDFADYAQIGAGLALLADAGLLNHFYEGAGAAVEDGELEVVELDYGVVDAYADEGGEQVLGGRDQDALFHQAGGVADAGDVAAAGFDGEAIEIGAMEDDARAGGSGQDSEVDGSSAVEADSGAGDGGTNCLFASQIVRDTVDETDNL